jgi:hypothetical protein
LLVAVVCAVGPAFAFSGCSSSPESAIGLKESLKQLQQIEIGMTKDEVRSLLGEPRRVRMIENAHPIRRKRLSGIPTAVLEGNVFEVWEYTAADGSDYGVLFPTATGRVEGTFAPGTNPAGTTP